ncbi:MAG: peptidoglycan DD-metalloendopeptidase family protein [Alphaproteobacteria bacterium]|nr:peptidoglycan DD-metalloendopeptidase family protein [Alphaproteobacteria bacterium]
MSNPRLGYIRVPFLAVVILTAATVLLSGCGLFEDDARPTTAPATLGGQPSNPGYHVVKTGDTLSNIAQRYDLGLGEVAAANDLQPPYALSVGQFLILPRPNVYEVQRGDNLYRIAVENGLEMDMLASANGIAAPYTIYPGQRLILPDKPQTPPLAGGPGQSATTGVASSPQSVPTIPPAVVTRNDLPGIATVPVSGSSGTAANDAANAPRVDTPPPVSKPQGASTDLPSPPAALLSPPPQRQQQTASAANPPPLAQGGFLWPVRGDVVSTFGPNSGGQHNDGINIAAPRGTPVVAAQSGIVIYAGTEIEGYGQLLIIKHADGWSTAYGHNDVLLVRRGDQVARGEAIARVGSTGDVTSPQLHFEIRRSAKAIDPIGHLG